MTKRASPGAQRQPGLCQQGEGVVERTAQDARHAVDAQQDVTGETDPHLLAVEEQAGHAGFHQIARLQFNALFSQQLADQPGAAA